MPKLKSLKDASIEDVEARLEELRSEFVDMSEGKRSDVDDDGLRDMIREVDLLDTWITMSAAAEARARQKVAATAGATGDRGFRSIGEAFCSPENLDFIVKGRGGTDGFRQDWEGDEGRKLSRWMRYAGIYGGSHLAEGVRAVDEWGSSGPPNFDATDAGGLLPRLGQPIPPVPRQAKLYLRDLIPSMTTTLPVIPYVRELNPTAGETVTGGGATTVAEGSTKPNAQLSFVSEQAYLTVVATTLTLSKQMFEDAPAVIAYINQRLPYLVKFREDAEFLNGSGTWPDIQGITNTPGLQSYDGTGNNDYAIDVGNAFALVEQQDGSPTAVVFNPRDAWTMFTKRAAGGSGTFDAGTPFSALPLTVWGVPTYRSRAYPQGSALVADFERGAMVADREQVNTQTYRERYAEQNLILLVCEERVGLMVFRPDLFVETTLS